MKKFFTYFSASLSLVFLALILWTCGGGGGDGGPNSPLAGTSDILEFITGDQIGWARANVSIDGSGNIFINNYTDSNDNILSDFDIQTKWVVDGSGTIREYDTSVDPNVINPYLYGHLASNNHFAVATDNDSTFPATWSLLVARKRDASVTFDNVDIQDKSFTYHQINGNVWTYGFGSIDLQGNVTMDSAFDPSGELQPPQGIITTLSVDSAGIVTSSPQNDFYGWLTNDKNTIFALIDNPGEYQFVAIQFLGDTYVQADLAGTWRFNILYGSNSPGWLKGTWTIDAEGTGTYDNTTLLYDTLIVPSLADETHTLDTDGIITNPASSSYHGMLSAGRDLYVRTRTTGTVQNPRYSIGISVK